MAGRRLSEIRRAAAQAKAAKETPKKPGEPAAPRPVETISPERVEVVATVDAIKEPVLDPVGEPEETRSLGEILADAKMRAARGEENEDILAMVKSLKFMLSDEK